MTTEMLDNFMLNTHPDLVPYVFIGCLIVVVLFAPNDHGWYYQGRF